MEETGFVYLIEISRRRKPEIMKNTFLSMAFFYEQRNGACVAKLEIPYDTFFYQFEDWEHDDRFWSCFEKDKGMCIYRCAVG